MTWAAQELSWNAVMLGLMPGRLGRCQKKQAKFDEFHAIHPAAAVGAWAGIFPLERLRWSSLCK